MLKSRKDLNKKERERYFLDYFTRNQTNAMRVIEEREEPDFVIADSVGEYGLELVQIFKDRTISGSNNGTLSSQSKANESQQCKYLQQIAKKYYSAGGKPLQVKALLSDGFDCDHEKIVQKLIDERPTDHFGQHVLMLAPDARFYLQSLPEDWNCYSKWIPVNNKVGWRKIIKLSDLQTVVQDKSNKICKYRKIREKIWLLLYADGTNSSGMILRIPTKSAA